jgi:hypothetical protein
LELCAGENDQEISADITYNSMLESGDEQEESDDKDDDLLMMIPEAVMMVNHSNP